MISLSSLKTRFAKQCPPLRSAIRLPSRTASFTISTTCSVVDGIRMASGEATWRLLPWPLIMSG